MLIQIIKTYNQLTDQPQQLYLQNSSRRAIAICMRQITYEQRQLKYFILGKIGSGTFGQVQRIREKRGKREFAMKRIKSNSIRERQEVLQQIQMMSHLSHPFVVKIFEFYEIIHRDQANKQISEIGIIMQLASMSLQQCIKSLDYQYYLEDVLKFLAKFIQLGAYFQCQNIVHRDIKPANIMIFGPKLDFKLIDFGLACRSDQRPHGFSGTYHYSSPYLKRVHDCGRKIPLISNGFKDDVFSLGITISEIMKCKRYQRLKNEAMSKNYTKQLQCLQILQSLLQEMLHQNENQRPTFLHLVQNRYVKNIPLEQPQIKDFLPRIYEPQVQNLKRSELIFQVKQQPEVIQMKTEIKQIKKQHALSIQKIGDDQTTYSIHCINRLNSEYVICGCSDGNIIVYNFQNKNRIVIQKLHEDFVSCIKFDLKGNMWTAGGDGRIFIWNRLQLMKAIKNPKTVIQKTRNDLGLEIVEKYLMVDANQRMVKELHYRPQHKNFENQHWSRKWAGVSFVECESQNKYALGFCDGFVLVKIGRQIMMHASHNGLVTVIHFSEKFMYSGGVDGAVKIYDIQHMKMERLFVKTDSPICDIGQGRQQKNIQILCNEGLIILINHNKEITFNTIELNNSDVIAAQFDDKSCYYLSDGALYEASRRENEVEYIEYKSILIEDFVNRGWSCILRYKDKQTKQILVGSYEGEIGRLNF